MQILISTEDRSGFDDIQWRDTAYRSVSSDPEILRNHFDSYKQHCTNRAAEYNPCAQDAHN